HPTRSSDDNTFAKRGRRQSRLPRCATVSVPLRLQNHVPDQTGPPGSPLPHLPSSVRSFAFRDCVGRGLWPIAARGLHRERGLIRALPRLFPTGRRHSSAGRAETPPRNCLALPAFAKPFLMPSTLACE